MKISRRSPWCLPSKVRHVSLCKYTPAGLLCKIIMVAFVMCVSLYFGGYLGGLCETIGQEDGLWAKDKLIDFYYESG